MGMNGNRKMAGLVAGTVSAAQLQTWLGTAVNYGSFADALGSRYRCGVTMNNPAALTAISGSALAQTLVGQSPAALATIAPLGSAARPYTANTYYATGHASFVTKTFTALNHTGSVRCPPVSVAGAWLIRNSADSNGANYRSHDGGNTWTATGALYSSGGSITDWGVANGFVYMSGINTDASSTTYIWRWNGVGNPSVILATGSAVALSNVAYGNSVYVVIQNNTTTGWSSANGTSFTSRTCIAVSTPTICHCSGPNIFTAQGSTNTGATTVDGITWTTRASQPNHGWNSPQIVASATTFVMGAPNGTSSQTIYTSTDGFIWATVTLPSSRARGTLYHANGMFFFTPYDGQNTFTYSNDGTTWYETIFLAFPTAADIFGYSASRGEIFAISNAGAGLTNGWVA